VRSADRDSADSGLQPVSAVDDSPLMVSTCRAGFTTSQADHPHADHTQTACFTTTLPSYRRCTYERMQGVRPSIR